MKRFYIILSILCSTLFLQTCELLENTGSNTPTAASLEGVWKCDENSELFKSALDLYNVYIEPHESDSMIVVISNFYQLGNDVYATASINGFSLTLSNQNLQGGYTINGSGSISSNQTTIDLSYRVNDGSGVWDNVEATYTFLY